MIRFWGSTRSISWFVSLQYISHYIFATPHVIYGPVPLASPQNLLEMQSQTPHRPPASTDCSLPLACGSFPPNLLVSFLSWNIKGPLLPPFNTAAYLWRENALEGVNLNMLLARWRSYHECLQDYKIALCVPIPFPAHLSLSVSLLHIPGP